MASATNKYASMTDRQVCAWALDFHGDWKAELEIVKKEMKRRGTKCHFGSDYYQPAIDAWRSGQHAKALDYARKGAAEGDLDLIYVIGNLHWNDDSPFRKDEEGIKWYTINAEMGDRDGQYQLGLINEKGFRKQPKNYSEAFRLYTLAADQGHEKAHVQLAYLHYYGKGIPKNVAKAKEILLKAQDFNNQYAYSLLGWIYENDESDIGSALPLYTKAAELDDVWSMRRLARTYQYSKSHIDYEKAVFWNEKAMQKGNGIATNDLGDLYENGRGVKQDTQKAIELYMKAIEMGEDFGKISMGGLYERGEYVERDLEKARKWYQDALNSKLSDGHREQAKTFLARVEDAIAAEKLAARYKRDPNRHDVAVIIGNQNYKKYGRDIPDVAPAINDAKQIKSYFTDILGIDPENIIYVEDAKTADLIRIFGNHRSHKGDAYSWVREGKSNLYVYYAGHGAPGDAGDAYLVPTDASADNIEISGYSVAQLYGNLSKIKTRSTTVILESCFSGNSDAGSVITNASPVYMKAQNTDIPTNLNVITAGSANELASWTKDKQNGLFTHYYIKGMSGEADSAEYGNQDGVVSTHELQAYLDDTVTYFAKRHYKREQTVQITLSQ
ncbi:caspase family protein [Curvivirga sp.]|uniref:caspase family protein n=1 Tax=Curvivirga sp. TaxID=2856848 RepID=UPI003B5BCC77